MLIYTNDRSKKSRKQKTRAKEKWQQYLADQNIQKKRKTFVPLQAAPVAYTRPGSDDFKKWGRVEDTTIGALTKTGIMRDFHKLSEADREIVQDVAGCTAPLHKGHYTYVSAGMNPAELGRKNEVL
jgi:hypothetical protein